MANEQVTYDFDKLLAQYPGLFKGLVAFVDEIRKYNSLSEAIAASEQRVKTAQDEADAFRATMVEKNEKLENEHAAKILQLNAAAAEHEREIAAQRRTLDRENEQRAQAAQDKVGQILAEGNVAKAAVDQRVADAQETALELEAEIEAKSKTLEGIKASISARQADLNRIEDSIAALRAKIA